MEPTRSQHTYPNLNHHHLSLLRINSASDLTSDNLSQSDSGSQSQTPGGSTTGRHHLTNNSRRNKPTSLSHYKFTEWHAPLAEAKESFAAMAFASGCYFYHQRSLYIDTFQTYARDAIAQAANAYQSKRFNLFAIATTMIALITANYIQLELISTKTS